MMKTKVAPFYLGHGVYKTQKHKNTHSNKLEGVTMEL